MDDGVDQRIGAWVTNTFAWQSAPALLDLGGGVGAGGGQTKRADHDYHGAVKGEATALSQVDAQDSKCDTQHVKVELDLAKDVGLSAMTLVAALRVDVLPESVGDHPGKREVEEPVAEHGAGRHLADTAPVEQEGQQRHPGSEVDDLVGQRVEPLADVSLPLEAARQVAIKPVGEDHDGEQHDRPRDRVELRIDQTTP